MNPTKSEMRNLTLAFVFSLCPLMIGCQSTKTTSLSTPQIDADLLSEAQFDFEHGQISEAKEEIEIVLAKEPQDQKALYYKNLIEQVEKLNSSRSPTPRGWYQTIPQQPIY